MRKQAFKIETDGYFRWEAFQGRQIGQDDTWQFNCHSDEEVPAGRYVERKGWYYTLKISQSCIWYERRDGKIYRLNGRPNMGRLNGRQHLEAVGNILFGDPAKREASGYWCNQVCITFGQGQACAFGDVEPDDAFAPATPMAPAKPQQLEQPSKPQQLEQPAQHQETIKTTANYAEDDLPF